MWRYEQLYKPHSIEWFFVHTEMSTEFILMGRVPPILCYMYVICFLCTAFFSFFLFFAPYYSKKIYHGMNHYLSIMNFAGTNGKHPFISWIISSSSITSCHSRWWFLPKFMFLFFLMQTNQVVAKLPMYVCTMDGDVRSMTVSWGTAGCVLGSILQSHTWSLWQPLGQNPLEDFFKGNRRAGWWNLPPYWLICNV